MSVLMSLGRWFGRTTAAGVVEGFAFLVVVSGALSLGSWLKGATFVQAALLGLFAIISLALALYLVSLAVVKFRMKAGNPVGQGEQERQIADAATVLEAILRERCRDHALRIDYYVRVEKVQIGLAELDRNDGYVEITLWIWNRSLCDIEISEPVGTLWLGERREFRQPLIWVDGNRIILWEQRMSFRLRQNLTAEDAEYLKTNQGEFGFHRVNITITGAGEFELFVEPRPLLLMRLPNALYRGAA